MTFPNVYAPPPGDEWTTKFNNAWSNTQPAERGEYDDVPDGTYQVQIEKARITHTREKHRPMLELQLCILGPSHANRRLWLRHLLDREEGYPYLMADLAIIGVDVSNAEELRAALDSMLNVRLEVAVRKKDEFTNVYINRRIDAQPAPPTRKEDNLPF